MAPGKRRINPEKDGLNPEKDGIGVFKSMIYKAFWLL
jgi:hypothetical protein